MFVKRNDRIVLRNCGDFKFLIDPFLSYNTEDEDIFQIDDIGKLIWNSIDDYVSLNEIIDIIIESIEDDAPEEMRDAILNDVEEFLMVLKEHSFVEIKNDLNVE